MRAYRDLPTGLVAGALAGLAAAFVMEEFQSFWTAFDKERQQSDAKPATLKAADAVSQSVAGEPVRPPAQKMASRSVHYLVGAAIGAVYGALAEFIPAVTDGYGSLYGALSWVAADEVMVPALGLSPPADETPAKDHIYGLASHLVFGVALEVARSTSAQVLAPR